MTPLSPDALMEHADRLYSYAYSRLRDHHSAEDMVQETLLAAVNSRDGFQGSSSLLTWLTGILRHKILEHFRYHSRRPVSSLEEQDPPADSRLFTADGQWRSDADKLTVIWDELPSSGLERADLRRQLDDCGERLPPRLRQLYLLGLVEEMDRPSLAELSGLSLGSLAVMMHRARLALRQCLETHLQEPPALTGSPL